MAGVLGPDNCSPAAAAAGMERKGDLSERPPPQHFYVTLFFSSLEQATGLGLSQLSSTWVFFPSLQALVRFCLMGSIERVQFSVPVVFLWFAASTIEMLQSDRNLVKH